MSVKTDVDLNTEDCMRTKWKLFLKQKTRTLLKLLELRHGKRELPCYAEKNFIFVDNKFEDYFEQIKFAFELGLLDVRNTLLVAKFYRTNFYKTQEAAAKIGLKTHFYYYNNQIPSISNKVVFYPYNAQINCRLILNRRACHVFLTHGESNKKSSVNRMVRLYDYIIASGDISCDRYLENGVLSQSDLQDGRVIKVGTALSASCFDYLNPHGDNTCVAYLPTWEGGNEEENFSSLASPYIAHFLISLCAKLGEKNIIIKAHPNLGGRIKRYHKHLAGLIETLRLNDIRVYVESSNKEAKKSAANVPENMSIKIGVCDVSASEFMLAAKKIPTILLINGEKEFFSTKKYMGLRKKFVVNINNRQKIDGFLERPLLKDDLAVFVDNLHEYAFSDTRREESKALELCQGFFGFQNELTEKTSSA